MGKISHCERSQLQVVGIMKRETSGDQWWKHEKVCRRRVTSSLTAVCGWHCWTRAVQTGTSSLFFFRYSMHWVTMSRENDTLMLLWDAKQQMFVITGTITGPMRAPCSGRALNMNIMVTLCGYSSFRHKNSWFGLGKGLRFGLNSRNVNSGDLDRSHLTWYNNDVGD